VSRRSLLEIVALVVVLLIVAAGLAWLPVGDTVLAGAERLRQLGPAGVGVLIVVYAAATVVMVPATPFPLIAGFLYGPVVGFLATWVGEVLGATACWALGRGVLQWRARSLLHRYAMLRAVESALAVGDVKLLVLLRLSPVLPFGVLNYTLGLVGVGRGPFLLSTAVGVVPLALVLAYTGSTLTHVQAALDGEPGGGPASGAVYWVGLAATVAAFAMISLATRRALRAELEQLG
jgi:uncharacterized membrane protein YdjX (TVP38/TMEM64 family)